MKLKRIEVDNFRSLKKFSINLEDDLSLVIGKNNTGKTSFLSVLQKFLTSSSNIFNFDDFCTSSQKQLKQLLESKTLPLKRDYEEIKIELRLVIEYQEEDSLDNIGDLILDLDPAKNSLIFSFKYTLSHKGISLLREDFMNHHQEDLYDFLKKYHKSYFELQRFVIDEFDTNNFVEVDFNTVKKVVSLKSISARRNVENEDVEGSKTGNTLSRLSYRYFKPFEDSKDTSIIELQKKLIETDKNLTTSYQTIFKKVTDDIKDFSYDQSEVTVRSNFQEINLLKENTSVVYHEDGHYLPEGFNGLGYMNLFSMIFELHIIFEQFKNDQNQLKPSDINLLFIEEPEAHTHPQMQYVFIKKIKEFLKKNKEDLMLQTVISTHSAHITSQSDFNDIKYFINRNKEIIVKNLSDLENEYTNDEDLQKDKVEKENFRFLKQYLTLQNSELFFSDKIIFIEGDSERILLPAMMKKLDDENKDIDDYIPLLSQKVSIVEVGAHSKVFDKFLKFLEIKTLIITDLDSVKKSKKTNNKGNEYTRGEKCPVAEGTETSNSSINYYLSGKSFEELKNMAKKDRILNHGNTQIYLTFQTSESGYHARSFEDSFLSLNIGFVKDNIDNFGSLQNIEKLKESDPNFYDIAENCIKKKTEFAVDVLYFSDSNFTNWKTPQYINQGLLWLGKLNLR